MDAAALEGRLEYPKSAVASGIPGMVVIYWYPATREHQARAVIASANRMAFIDAVQSGLQAAYPEIPVSTVIKSIGNEQIYEVIFEIDSIGGKYAGHVHVRARGINRASNGKSDSTRIPDKDEFVPVDSELVWDQADLQRRLPYPAEAEANNIEGKVIVYVLVDRNGVVRDTDITYSDSPILAAAAIEASINTHFTPAKSNGVSVAVWVQVPVNFRKAGH